MHIRPSRVLKKLRVGAVVSCAKINLANPRCTEIAAMCGFDCVWLDTEHVPNDWQSIEKQIRSAKIYDVDTLVRVARGSYSDYIKPLEAAYCMIDFNEYIKTANQQSFVVVQIEDHEPLDELEEIAKLDGIDMIFFGPADFSQSIGTPGRWDHSLIAETRRRVAKVAQDNGKFAGTVGDLDNLQELIDMGYQFINAGADVVGLSDHFKQSVASFKGTNTTNTNSNYKGK